jgi:hypothetical protein
MQLLAISHSKQKYHKVEIKTPGDLTINLDPGTVDMLVPLYTGEQDDRTDNGKAPF